jgi:Sec-independent protein translocase protein TatA
LHSDLTIWIVAGVAIVLLGAVVAKQLAGKNGPAVKKASSSSSSSKPKSATRSEDDNADADDNDADVSIEARVGNANEFAVGE